MFFVQPKREEIEQWRRTTDEKKGKKDKKKKGRRRSNWRCKCGGNLLHWGLFKSCIFFIFPFSFCTGRISLFQPKRLVYSGMACIV